MSTDMIAALADLARQRQTELDEQISTWRQGAGAAVRLWCGPGCGNCCTLAVNVTLPEALAIASSLSVAQLELVAETTGRILAHARQCSDARRFLAGYKQAVGPCPFLDGAGNCTIYEIRPLACRALLATRPADWCGVNLTQLPDYERNAFLASLDRSVVTFPTHYAAAPQKLAADFERGLVFAMLRFAGFGLTGNLSLLNWLAGKAGFAEALAGGPAAFLSFLTDRHITQPFLVQMDVP